MQHASSAPHHQQAARSQAAAQNSAHPHSPAATQPANTAGYQQNGQSGAETTLHASPGHEHQNVAPSGDQQDGTQQTMWMARPHMVDAPDIPEEALRRHEESIRKYPELNLSKGEFVISAVRRHPIGLISIWLVSALVVLLALGLLLFVFINQATFTSGFGNSGSGLMILFTVVFVLLAGLALVGGLISTYVYVQNKFFLTNESVIQFIQISLFSRKEQTVSLSNIEDASYRQHGIVQYLFNYGNIRLSTQGDETTYRFSYVANPKHQIALLNNAVEAFKMGRPVMHMDDQ